MNKPLLRKNERGNVFLFILMGVVLFAALSYTVASSFRGETTNRLSQREATLAASDILTYAQRIERAINKLRRKGTSENDISFDNPQETGYNHSVAQPDRNKVFHKSGGGIGWQAPPANAASATWLFTGSTCVEPAASTCETDSTSNEELLLVLPNINETVCETINDRLNTTLVTDSVGGYSSTKFTGTYADGTELIIPTSANAACYTDGTNFHFFWVLLER